MGRNSESHSRRDGGAVSDKDDSEGRIVMLSQSRAALRCRCKLGERGARRNDMSARRSSLAFTLCSSVALIQSSIPLQQGSRALMNS